MKGAYSLRFSRSAETYDRWALPQRETAKRLVEFVKPEGKVLDLGCGTGFVSESLSPECSSVGVDISEKMVYIYRQKFGRGIVGDAECLPFKNRSFDYVLSNFSLHWTELGKSLEESFRVARIGVGIAIPIEGSLRELSFPFPSEEEVVRHVNNRCMELFIEEVEIPFRGWDLVRFFHHTGSSLNPLRKRVLSKREIELLINSIEKPVFRMLFLYAGV